MRVAVKCPATGTRGVKERGDTALLVASVCVCDDGRVGVKGRDSLQGMRVMCCRVAATRPAQASKAGRKWVLWWYCGARVCECVCMCMRLWQLQMSDTPSRRPKVTLSGSSSMITLHGVFTLRRPSVVPRSPHPSLLVGVRVSLDPGSRLKADMRAVHATVDSVFRATTLRESRQC
jgi:hypothetical protein